MRPRGACGRNLRRKPSYMEGYQNSKRQDDMRLHKPLMKGDAHFGRLPFGPKTARRTPPVNSGQGQDLSRLI